MVQISQKSTSRDRIMTASSNLFSFHGFHQTSITDIAAAAQVSVGQIYRHFKNKEEIIFSIIRSDTEARITTFSNICENIKNREITLELGFQRLALSIFCGSQEALSFEILAEAHRNASVGDEVARLCQRYRAMIRDLVIFVMQKRDLHYLSAIEELFLACIFGLAHRSLSQPRLSAHQASEQAAGIIMTALKGLEDGTSRHH